MIDLYTYGTFNGRQVSIALEELGLQYVVHKVDLLKGEQHEAAFRAINPSGRIPAIVDHSVAADDLFCLSQTSAILIYLAEKCDELLPKEPVARATTLEWLAFQATDISTSLFNVFFLSNLVEVAQQEAAALLRTRALSFYRYFDQNLAHSTYLSGDEYTIADIATYPVVSSVIDRAEMNQYQHIKQWFNRISERAAVIRGMKVPG